MLACARRRAVHSVVFGGFAAKELATGIDDAEPKVILTASCGVEPGPDRQYKPLLDLAISLRRHKPSTSVIYQRPAIKADMNKAPTNALVDAALTAGKRGAVRDLAATIRSTFSTPPARLGMPRSVVRDIGGYQVALNVGESPTSSLAKPFGPAPTSVGSLAHPTSSMRRCCRLLDRLARGQPGRNARRRPLIGGSSRTIRFPHSSPRRPACAPCARKTRRPRSIKTTTSVVADLVPRRRQPTRTRSRGLRQVLGVPVVDHWWHPRAGWPIAPIPSAWECSRSSSARRACRPARLQHSRRRRRDEPYRGGMVDSSSRVRCRRAACQRSTARSADARELSQ